MNKQVLDVAERAVSTALFTFIAVVPVANVTFSASEAHVLAAAGVASAAAAVQSLIKNTLAYLSAQGNGPDAALTFNDGGKDVPDPVVLPADDFPTPAAAAAANPAPASGGGL